MKFLTLVALATGVAASVVRRDVSVITGVLGQVGTDLDGLNTAAKGFSGDPSALLDASNKAIQDLKDGDAKVQAVAPLSLTDALALTGPSKDLQTKGDALLATMKDKKAALAAAGLCDVTRLQVTDLQTASNALIKTIVSKVPAAAQSIAQSLVAPLQQDLAAAVDLFSAANCVNTGGGSPTTTGPASSTPPATTTAAPTSTKPPVTTSAPTVPTTTTKPGIPTTTAPGPGNGTCPAAETVTVTSTDTKDCTPTPTCTKSAPVTVTTTTKACPTGSKLPW
ncbi:cell wall galactomannoprotein Mp2/allergen F17-like protein [Cordyceps fumosorosea ARSEF 2679]|uniref:Cell wall galactomannoprotein Mp2/allergen F17-like protein n=1 Tax=Cordyceps fumosorosea (strain ARSEF 2679) TaxID=1081104 RepID=A0A167QP67_CORFA|nr:cell wall galactomannoprotein Mp2/allergen F17-like protein [Cordyceps fumosorosea ARSEF 2679]OAA57821.1 cell wall galactomannoprotein Mp2/allergen F17-like protein [Cordyceps fumosorosea ARSEF 2679]